MAGTQAVSGDCQLPIFPLGTVLFPEGVLPLRIFEVRYMDMIRGCLKSETDFGVCLITEGKETGQPAQHMPVGCAAKVHEWDMEQLGLLNIRTLGQRRFEVVNSQVQPDGLIMAQVEYRNAEPDAFLPDDFEPCVDLLKKIAIDLVEKESDPLRKMIERPYRYDSASWVSNRLCEFLPFAAPVKQELMELDDPLTRLSAVMEFLTRKQII